MARDPFAGHELGDDDRARPADVRPGDRQLRLLPAAAPDPCRVREEGRREREDRAGPDTRRPLPALLLPADRMAVTAIGLRGDHALDARDLGALELGGARVRRLPRPPVPHGRRSAGGVVLRPHPRRDLHGLDRAAERARSIARAPRCNLDHRPRPLQRADTRPRRGAAPAPRLLGRRQRVGPRPRARPLAAVAGLPRRGGAHPRPLGPLETVAPPDICPALARRGSRLLGAGDRVDHRSRRARHPTVAAVAQHLPARIGLARDPARARSQRLVRRADGGCHNEGLEDPRRWFRARLRRPERADNRRFRARHGTPAGRPRVLVASHRPHPGRLGGTAYPPGRHQLAGSLHDAVRRHDRADGGDGGVRIGSIGNVWRTRGKGGLGIAPVRAEDEPAARAASRRR